MRRKVIFSFFLPLLVSGLAACGSETKKTDTGTGPTPDAGTPAAPPPALTCSGDCKDFVVNKAIVPTSDALKYGFIYEGKPNNALGSILGLLAGQVPTLNLQETIDNSLNAGKVTILLALQATDFSNDAKAKGQSWIGDAKACCANPDDAAACATEAQTTCFGGTAEFTPAATSPKDATFWATITGGAFSGVAPKILLSLPVGTGTLDLNLKQVQVKGKLVGDKITDGILAGVIPSADVQTSIIPMVHKMIADALEDPTVTEQTKTTIKQLFDTETPKDGKVSLDEVKNNGIIKSFLKGDLDLDKDANHEPDHLSMGVGFTAVKAVIKK